MKDPIETLPIKFKWEKDVYNRNLTHSEILLFDDRVSFISKSEGSFVYEDEELGMKKAQEYSRYYECDILRSRVSAVGIEFVQSDDEDYPDMWVIEVEGDGTSMRLRGLKEEQAKKYKSRIVEWMK